MHIKSEEDLVLRSEWKSVFLSQARQEKFKSTTVQTLLVTSNGSWEVLEHSGTGLTNPNKGEMFPIYIPHLPFIPSLHSQLRNPAAVLNLSDLSSSADTTSNSAWPAKVRVQPSESISEQRTPALVFGSMIVLRSLPTTKVTERHRLTSGSPTPSVSSVMLPRTRSPWTLLTLFLVSSPSVV